jgi:hypothetical protein
VEGLEKIWSNAFFSVHYGRYQWWDGEVYSSGHDGGERGCYRCTWSFLNTSVLQLY